MPNPVPPLDTDGKLRPYTEAEVELMEITHPGVKDGSHPTHKRRPDDCTIAREYFCAYDELESFLCHMLGTSVIYNDPLDSDNPTLSRLLPQLYPGKPQMRCVGLESATGFAYTGEMNADDVPVYERWRCRMLFQNCPFEIADDSEITSEHRRYVIELPSTAQSDYITLPGGVLKYVRPGGGTPNGNAIQHSVGFVDVTTQVKKKWLKIPYDGWAQGSLLRTRVYGNIEDGVQPYLGTINKTTIFGYAPGQLLLVGAEDQLEFDPLAGEPFWNITYTWLARSVSHNWFYFFSPSGTNNGWYFASNNGTDYTTGSLPDGKSLFNAREHLDLFKVGNP